MNSTHMIKISMGIQILLYISCFWLSLDWLLKFYVKFVLPIIFILIGGNEKANCKEYANRNPNGNTNKDCKAIANGESSEEKRNINQQRTSEDPSNNRNNKVNKKYGKI